MGRRQQGADQRDEAMDCSPSLLYGDRARELQPTFLDGGFIPCPFPPVPAGFHTLTPYMTITGAPRANRRRRFFPMTHSYRTFRAVRSVYETRGSPHYRSR